jgi:CobQ-like glutamine amidotransferase family enzyme
MPGLTICGGYQKMSQSSNVTPSVSLISTTFTLIFLFLALIFKAIILPGGSDREQSLATKQLSKIKTPLKEVIEDGMPGLTICGGYQFLGTKYITPDGQLFRTYHFR